MLKLFIGGNSQGHNDLAIKAYNGIIADGKEDSIESIENADVIVSAYGTVARIVKNVIKDAAKEGIKVGLIRPITLWPFPVKSFEKYAETPKGFLTVEMSAGQMVEDVRLAVNGRNTVDFYGRTGGNVPAQSDILQKVREIAGRR